MARNPILARAHGHVRPRRRRDDARCGHPRGGRLVGARRLLAAAVSAGLALLFLTSCASRLTKTPSAVPPPGDAAYAEGAVYLKDAEYERAVDRFAAAWKENPKHPGVARDYAEAVTGLRNSADDAYRQGRPDEAGRKWTAALRAVGHPAARGHAFPFARADLRSSIDRATALLMEKALIDYRKGNLEAAIASWRGILSYEPANEEAAKSLKTATTQLENLKKITVPKEAGS